MQIESVIPVGDQPHTCEGIVQSKDGAGLFAQEIAAAFDYCEFAGHDLMAQAKGVYQGGHHSAPEAGGEEDVGVEKDAPSLHD